MQKEKYPIDYDNNWKAVVTAMIDDFLAFFIPKLHADVDFTKPIDFLEQELYDSEQIEDKERIVDKLARVWLKTGQDRLVFIHIEFQTSAESDFSERMYHYYHQIRSKYGKDVTAIVIYTGRHKPRLHDHYKEDTYGTSLTYRFNTYNIIKQSEQELLANPNPFALVVLANYYVLKTKANQKERLTFKEKIFDLATERGYTREKTTHLILFITELMRLIPNLHEEFISYYSQSKKHKIPMFKYSQDTLDVIDAGTEVAYGTTIPKLMAQLEAGIEAKAELEAMVKAKTEAEARAKAEAEAMAKAEAEAKARAKAEAEARAKAEAEAEADVKAKTEKLYTVIVRCFAKLNMSIEEIAELTDQQPDEVRKVLLEKKMIVA